MEEQSYVVTMLVANKPGVTSRVTGLFSGRGYNMESICGAPTHDPEVSRITIKTKATSDQFVEIQKQLDLHGHKSAFENDIRITDETSLALIKQAVGAVQIELQARLSMGLANSPMQGASIRTVVSNVVTAQPIGVKGGVDYCHAGKVRRIDVEGLKIHLDMGAIPVISPLGYSVTGEVYPTYRLKR